MVSSPYQPKKIVHPHSIHFPVPVQNWPRFGMSVLAVAAVCITAGVWFRTELVPASLVIAAGALANHFMHSVHSKAEHKEDRAQNAEPEQKDSSTQTESHTLKSDEPWAVVLTLNGVSHLDLNGEVDLDAILSETVVDVGDHFEASETDVRSFSPTENMVVSALSLTFTPIELMSLKKKEKFGTNADRLTVASCIASFAAATFGKLLQESRYGLGSRAVVAHSHFFAARIVQAPTEEEVKRLASQAPK